MCGSKRGWRIGRRRLAVREETAHLLLLFALGLFVYFYLIKLDRTAVPTLFQGDGVETFQKCPGREGEDVSPNILEFRVWIIFNRLNNIRGMHQF